eukprot:5663503-Heterocapsa_arctica.AAC.1
MRLRNWSMSSMRSRMANHFLSARRPQYNFVLSSKHALRLSETTQGMPAGKRYLRPTSGVLNFSFSLTYA